MVLAIDGYEANVEARVGIGQYAYEIITHLHALMTSEKDPPLTTVYVPTPPRADMPEEGAWWKYRMMQPGNLWTVFGLPLGLLTQHPKPDVVFSPTHYAPRFVTIPKIISIMDLSFLTYPDLFRASDRYKLTHWTAHSVAHAARIFTISAFSKRAIIDRYGVPEKRVIVTYPGFRMPKKYSASFERVAREYSLDHEFILSVGTIQPRKNYERLIEAFSHAVRKAGGAKDLDLVIVGKKGWLYDDILAAPKTYHVESRVKFLEYVPDSDLALLYAHAVCFVMPSLYEGFGFPVLEAMAYGCPVVVSRTSSLPEIAGESGIYVDPEDIESIAHGLVTALTSRGSREEKERIEKGHQQVKKFSWETAAKKTLEVIEEVGK
jgi:glycosyltransferase involved in cell wall biosynthesis